MIDNLTKHCFDNGNAISKMIDNLTKHCFDGGNAIAAI